MNYENLTEKVQQILMEAVNYATSMQNNAVSNYHIAKAMLNSQDLDLILEEAEVSKTHMQSVLDQELQKLPRVQGAQMGMDSSVQKAFDKAQK